jgi:hypothetical protein
MRALAIGAGLGVVAGLLAALFQWLVVRRHVPDAGRLIPATTAGWTLAGLSGALLLYALDQSVALYGWNLPVQGIAAAFVAGLVGAGGPWVVLRQWAGAGTGGRRWGASALCGTTLGAASAGLLALVAISDLSANLDGRAWATLLLSTLLIGGLVGGAIYGRFVTAGLRQVLPGAPESPAPAPAPRPRLIRPASVGAGRDRGTAPPSRRGRGQRPGRR